MYDQLTTMLEGFVHANPDVLTQARRQVFERVFEPLAGSHNLSNQRSFDRLSECYRSAELMFEEIARNYPRDVLFSLMRRFPASAQPNETGICARAILKFARDETKVIAKNVVVGRHTKGLLIGISEDDILELFRLSYIAEALALIDGWRRWVGKGSRVFSYDEGKVILDTPPEIAEAIVSYEARRPTKTILHDAGTPVSLEMGARDHAAIALARATPGFRAHVTTLNVWLLLKYLPALFPLEPVANLLKTYSEPLRELRDVPAEALLHLIASITKLVAITITPIEESDPSVFRFVANPSNPDSFDHCLEFTFGLLHKGYLRFSRSYLTQALANVTTEWVTDCEQSRSYIEKSLAAFVIAPGDLSNLQLASQGGCFLFEGVDGYVHIDFLAFFDFLRGLIEDCKRWYSSVHGDRFTLFVKTAVKAAVPTVDIRQKVLVPLPNGQSDADILIAFKDELLLVECKAFGKSNDYFVGSPKAISARRDKVRQAVKQAKRNSSALEAAIRNQTHEIHEPRAVRWAVCTPSQEFLVPLAEFGMLAPNIPAVLTPEELIKFCEQKLTMKQF